MKSTVSGGLRSRIVSDVLIVISLSLTVFYFQSYQKDPADGRNEISKALLFQPDKQEPSATDDFPILSGPVVIDDLKNDQPIASEKNSSIGPFAPLVPPIPALNKPFNYDQIETGVGKQITTTHNSVITIPSNAFVDVSGNPVTGKVDISYREFYDRWDMFVSNIPMHYDSAGNDLLESAGMIELRATQNGANVFPNPDKKIDVLLSRANKDEGYNTYYYDEKINQWKYVAPETRIVERVPDKTEGNATTLTPSAPRQKGYYQYTKRKYSSSLYCVSDMAPHKSFLFWKKQGALRFNFKILPRKDSPPENNFLRNYFWSYSGNDATDVYKMIFMNGKSQFFPGRMTVVDNMQIDRSDSGYTLSFNRDKVHFSLAILPFYENEQYMPAFDVAFSKYKSAYNARLNSDEDMYAQFIADSTDMMKDRESSATYTNQSNILTYFSVNNFGLWNCDRPLRANLPKTVLAKFSDVNGRTILITNGYMVFRNINSVVAVDDPGKFRFNPRGGNLFWAVLSRNRVAIVYPEEFAKHESDSRISNFTVKIYDDVDAAKTAMRKIVGSKLLG
jgi:hypothetical protein